MSLLVASCLTKAYGSHLVFENVSLAIARQAHIALVGANGIGKTTLLRLLIGLEDPDSGRIHRKRGLRISYLPQEVTFSKSRQSDLQSTIWGYCLGAFAPLVERERELQRLEAAMAKADEGQRMLERYGSLQESFEREGGYIYQAQIRRVLNGLGFSPEEFGRTLSRLSGGERTRAMLARLILEQPDLLVLDEPTNHLDIEAIEWMEGWLGGFSGSALIVSHDRYFLDRVVSSVWELSPQGIESYRGNYSAYVRLRGERRQLQQKRYKAQQEHVRKEEEYIRRNIAGQNTRQAQGRRKRLQRLLRDQAISAPRKARSVSIVFGDPTRSGDRVLETEGLEIGYRETPEPLFLVPDLLLTRGECAAIIGPNGAGKTTFLRTLMGQIEPLAGEVRLGVGLRVGYFAQAHEDLQPGRTVLQEIMAIAPEIAISKARNLLALYLFTGNQVDKPVSVLSGGERGRLALARLTLQGANLLLLDEPTNHLDLPSQEILQEALAGFPGTILLVSHDRYLIDGLATQVWAVLPEERELRVYREGYPGYLAARRGEAQAARPGKRRRSGPGKPRSMKIQPGRNDLRALEAKIDRMEQELARLAKRLAETGTDVDRISHLGALYARQQDALDAELAAWEALAKKLDGQTQ